MPIKAITFDLDDTLWPLKPTLIHAENETYEWLKINAEPLTNQFSLADISEFRFKLFNDDVRFKNQISLVRKETIKAFALRSHYTEAEAIELAEQAFSVHYQLRQKVNCYEGVEELLSTLSKQHVLGTISNGNADVKQTCIGHHFSFALSAEHINSSKPDALIFNTALSHIENLMGQRLDPSEVAHVGDDFLCDIVGAKRAQFKAIWLEGHGHNCMKKHEYQKENASGETEGIVADAIISHIKDLPAALINL
ncbi:MAG: HAD family hydrolase [Cellvibrionales bacterium]|jgi:HAD superfamily hydrolase (TIGR01549 family)|nr:HAD family hydrolase [Cellvibrionales bacterium]MBT6579437.1 HAD family hydrolase [Cellvibrionales bacterium]